LTAERSTCPHVGRAANLFGRAANMIGRAANLCCQIGQLASAEILRRRIYSPAQGISSSREILRRFFPSLLLSLHGYKNPPPASAKTPGSSLPNPTETQRDTPRKIPKKKPEKPKTVILRSETLPNYLCSKPSKPLSSFLFSHSLSIQ
jgi:hypothetical protein